MKAKFIKPALLLTGILFFLSLVGCTPKCIINGRVVDAETEHPIKGASVAVRWYEDPPETNSGTTQTSNFARDLADEDGYFTIPDRADKNFVMGGV